MMCFEWHVQLLIEPLVVVANLDVVGMPCVPFEANAPLAVDANAPLSFTNSAQLLEMIADWDPKVPKIARCIQLLQFHQGTTLNGSRKLPR
jgi:hypothetical protein